MEAVLGIPVGKLVASQVFFHRGLDQVHKFFEFYFWLTSFAQITMFQLVKAQQDMTSNPPSNVPAGILGGMFKVAVSNINSKVQFIYFDNQRYL